jgi:hypothetical protein
MTEIRCRELVGAYAVGALEPPEAAVLADHLLTCLRCRHVLAEAEETAAMLAAVPPEMFLDEPADPNDPLLRRTLQAIRLEAAAPQVAGQAQAAQAQAGIRHPSGPLPLTRPAPRQPSPAAAEGGFPGWSGQTARSHRRRAQATTATEQRRRYMLVGAAAAAVLVLGGGVMLGSKLTGDGSDQPSSPTRAQQAASVRTATPAPSSSAAAEPEAKVFAGSNSTTKVSATINVTPSDDQVQLTGTVTGLKPGQECKLYVVDDVGAQTFVSKWTAPKDGDASVDAVATIDPARQVVEVDLLNAQNNEVLVTTHAT